MLVPRHNLWVEIGTNTGVKPGMALLNKKDIKDY